MCRILMSCVWRRRKRNQSCSFCFNDLWLQIAAHCLVMQCLVSIQLDKHGPGTKYLFNCNCKTISVLNKLLAPTPHPSSHILTIHLFIYLVAVLWVLRLSWRDRWLPTTDVSFGVGSLVVGRLHGFIAAV